VHMAEVVVSKASWLIPGFGSSALICFHEIIVRCARRPAPRGGHDANYDALS
jgi:hypothetical protein